MEKAAEQQKTGDTGALAIGKRFGGYGPESEKAVGKADIRKDEVLAHLIEAWGKLCTQDYYSVPTLYERNPKTVDRFLRILVACEEERYEEMMEGRLVTDRGHLSHPTPLAMSSLHYSKDDVERFTIAFPEFQEKEGISRNRTGLFLSALANLHESSSMVFATTSMIWLPWYMGFKNTKSLEIKGNAGHFLGAGMEDGEIIVNGDAGALAGCYMSGGLIHIKGDVSGVPYPKGGHVIIEGNARIDLRRGFWLYGYYEDCGYEERLENCLSKGLLTLKGKLIAD
jgi:hypothetical protein